MSADDTDRNDSGDETAGDDAVDETVDASLDALNETRRRLAEVSAEVVVLNHAMALYELAATHLSAELGEVADTLAGLLGRAPPERGPAASVSAELPGMLTANRGIANRRLREELGNSLRYPSWRSGL